MVLALLAVLAMSGCASTSPTMQQLAMDEAKASEIRAKAAEEKRAEEQKKMEATLSKVPAWALEQPRPDSTGVYAVGIGESDNMRVSMRKAMLDAEFGLAKVYDQEVSGSERSHTQDANGRGTTSQYTELIDKLVTQVPVVGFEVVRQEIKPIDGKYNTFVLVKLPYSQFNSVLKEQKAKAEAQDATVAKAFDDLERRVNQRRQQRIEDDARKQNAISNGVAQVSNAGAPATSAAPADATAVKAVAKE